MNDGVYLNELEPHLTGLYDRVERHAARLGVKERAGPALFVAFRKTATNQYFDLLELLLALADRLELLERSIELIEGRRDE